MQSKLVWSSDLGTVLRLERESPIEIMARIALAAKAQRLGVCTCTFFHGAGHQACYKAGEHVCTPCECDCHY